MSVLLFAVSAAPALAAAKDPVQAANHLEKVIVKVAASVFIGVVAIGAIPLLTGRRHGDLGRHMGMAVVVGLPVLAGTVFLGLLTGLYAKI